MTLEVYISKEALKPFSIFGTVNKQFWGDQDVSLKWQTNQQTVYITFYITCTGSPAWWQRLTTFGPSMVRVNKYISK